MSESACTPQSSPEAGRVRGESSFGHGLRHALERRNLSRGLFAFSCLFLAFAAGLRVGEAYQLSVLTLAREAYSTVVTELAIRTGFTPVPFLRTARYSGSGVTRLEPDRVEPGLTLLAGFFDGGNEIRLMQPDGTIVRRWPVRFSELFSNADHVPAGYRPQTDWNIDIHGALALPDGSIVFNFEYLGMAKLDRCGRVEWTLPMMTHHSIERSSDGGFWVPGRRYVGEASRYPPLKTPYVEDAIWKVSADGKLIEEISVPEILFNNGGLKATLLANGLKPVTILELELVHLNDIEELGEEAAASFPQFEAGDLLVSLRDLNLIMVVDPVTRTVKWHQTGPWIRQHDPDFLPDGTISVFNNNADDTETGSFFGGSNIMTLDPATGKVRVRYGGRAEERMFTNIRGKHQVMASGALLITESEAGRVFEVDPEGQVVWEYVNRYDEDNVLTVTQAVRYPDDYFTVEDWTCPEGPSPD